MSIGTFLYRYVFKGIGWLFLGAMITIAAVSLSSCGGHRPAQEPPKKEVARALKAQKEDASKQMREFKLETAPRENPRVIKAAK